MSLILESGIMIAVISFFGVLVTSTISSIISVKIARNTATSEINRQKAASFLDKLTSKRIECYPYLYSIISNIVKIMKSEPLGDNGDLFDINFLRKEIVKINHWDNSNSVFLGSNSIKNIIKMKSVIYSIIHEYQNINETISSEDRMRLTDSIADLELSLKNDIGIFPLEDISGKNKIPTYGDIDNS